MKTIPIQSEKLECLGIACDVHARCANYQRIEGSTEDNPRIGTCMTSEGFPLFVESPHKGVEAT